VGDTTVGYSFVLAITHSSFVFCVSNTTSGISNEAFALGGAVSLEYGSYFYPKSVQKNFVPTSHDSELHISRCTFSKSGCISSSLLCSPGANNAAGGAIFASIFRANLRITLSSISDASVTNDCAAPRSQTYSAGGGLAVLQAGSAFIDSTLFLRCVAKGVRKGTNVLVAGGGIYIQRSSLFTLQNSLITASGVNDAFSGAVVACGGGAFGTRHVPAIRIYNCTIYNNSDSCSSGVILLQHLDLQSDLIVDIRHSIASTDPSMSAVLPVLNISCGLGCPIQQQQRIRINITSSTLLAENALRERFHSASVMALPPNSVLSAADSRLMCEFESFDSIAVLAFKYADQLSLACAPCVKPVHIAMTSRSMNLINYSKWVLKLETPDSCRSLVSKALDKQSCPYGVSSCNTVANVAMGFWTSFAADGSVGDAIPCPSNYCGCRTFGFDSDSTCPLFAPFAAEYQPDDALCIGNRTGILCGSCKPNFTQSLNGYSCISNDVCEQNLGWVWAVSVLGFFAYSVYIVRKSLKIKSDGLLTCVLFFGQISSFASIPPISAGKSQNPAESAWLSKVAQFESVLSLYENTCYGPSMGAYEAKLAQLTGPAIVFVTSLVLTGFSGQLQLRFSKFFRTHNLEFRESFGVALINVLLMLFSSVTHVVFQLITCVDVRDSDRHDQRRVFIDGTKLCSGMQHNLLVAAAVLLSGVPVLFCAALQFGKISNHTRAVVCSAYTDSKFFWIAVQLFFRFVVTVLSALVSEVPSFAALAVCICTMFKLALLIAFRPYIEIRTYYMDVFCHAFLIVLFLLQTVVRASESMGFSVPEGNRFYDALKMASTASSVLRCVHFVIKCCIAQVE
jgi:hypothetical protein